jgi:hypothetical protein
MLAFCTLPLRYASSVKCPVFRLERLGAPVVLLKSANFVAGRCGFVSAALIATAHITITNTELHTPPLYTDILKMQ